MRNLSGGASLILHSPQRAEHAMEQIMNNIILSTALASAIALSGTAMAEQMKIKEIDVQTDMDAIKNAEAATVWHKLDEDLETAILAKMTDRVDDKGAIVMVDIDEVSLANNFEMATGLEDSTLRGWVKIDRTFMEKGEEVESPEELYELTVTAMQAQAHFPDGTDMAAISVDSDVFYNAMVAAFADNITEKLSNE